MSGGRVRRSTWRAALMLFTGVFLASTLAWVVIPTGGAVDRLTLVLYWLIAASLGIVGALVATRQPRNAVGWILWGSSVGVTVSIVAISYTALAQSPGGSSVPVVPLIAWLSQVGLTPAIIAIIVFVPLLFPDGRLPGSRWQFVAAYAVVMLGLVMVGNMFMPGPFPDTPTIDNPIGLQAVELLGEPIEFAKGPGVLIAAILAIASAVVRYRRASVVARTQLRWFGAAAGLTIALFAITILASAPGIDLGAIADLGWISGITSLSLIPVAIGIAILRYRLYEIDRIISRTIGWAIVSGLLVAAFAGLVVLLEAVLAPVTRESTLAVAASTLVACALFQPLRRAVQRAVDRRFDRARYDGQRLADAFGVLLQQEVDVNAAHSALVATATSAVQPQAAALWLRGQSG